MNICDIKAIFERRVNTGGQTGQEPVIRCVDCAIPAQPREVYYGNREYKRHLLLPNNHSMHRKSTQLLFRLNEGNGKALYLIGVEDSGRVSGLAKEDMLASLDNFIQMSQIIKCNIEKINVYRIINETNRYITTIRISRQQVQICEDTFIL